MTGIRDLFTKQSSTATQQVTDEPITRLQSISEISALIHNCISKIQKIELTIKDHETTIQEHEKIIERFDDKYDKLQCSFDKFRQEMTSKVTQLETFKKRADAIFKNIGEFDNDINNLKLNKYLKPLRK